MSCFCRRETVLSSAWHRCSFLAEHGCADAGSKVQVQLEEPSRPVQMNGGLFGWEFLSCVRGGETAPRLRSAAWAWVSLSGEVLHLAQDFKDNSLSIRVVYLQVLTGHTRRYLEAMKRSAERGMVCDLPVITLRSLEGNNRATAVRQTCASVAHALQGHGRAAQLTQWGAKAAKCAASRWNAQSTFTAPPALPAAGWANTDARTVMLEFLTFLRIRLWRLYIRLASRKGNT